MDQTFGAVDRRFDTVDRELRGLHEELARQDRSAELRALDKRLTTRTP